MLKKSKTVPGWSVRLHLMESAYRLLYAVYGVNTIGNKAAVYQVTCSSFMFLTGSLLFYYKLFTWWLSGRNINYIRVDVTQVWVAVAHQKWGTWSVIYLLLRLSPGRLDPISYQGRRKVIPEFIKCDFFWIYRCIVLNKSCSNGHLVMLKHIKIFMTDENLKYHHVTRNIQNWPPVTVWMKHLLQLASSNDTERLSIQRNLKVAIETWIKSQMVT